MKRVATVVILCVVLGACVFLRTRPSSDAQRFESAADRPSANQYETEQQWIISEIAGSILNIAAFARGAHDVPLPHAVRELRVESAPERARFSIARGSSVLTVDVTDHIWSSGAYVPFARAALSAAKDDSRWTDSTVFRDVLTRPTPTAIQAENRRISGQLRKTPQSADLHQQAALLLGALALRESAGPLSDPRHLMSRMTAHLAVAAALRPNVQTVDGMLAEATLAALANRQAELLTRLNSLVKADPSPSTNAWRRALQVRVTKDWRIVPDVGSATLLEQREVLRAAQLSVGDARSLPLLDLVNEPEDPADFARVLFHESPSVETGNRFAQTSLDTELRDAIQTRNDFPKPIDAANSAAVVRALNVEPSSGPAAFDADSSFWVIDWGTWAASSQRHIAAAIVCSSRHLRKMLALPEEATEFDRQTNDAFAALTLYPLVAREIAKDRKDAAAYAQATAAAGNLARNRPYVMTNDVWGSLFEKPDFAAVPAGLPVPTNWFAPYFPAGTAYDPRRIYGPGYHLRVDRPRIEQLKALAPFERDLVLRAADLALGPKPSAEALQAAIGQLAEYDTRAAWKVARAAMDRPEFYVSYVSNIAETMSPDDYYWVAEYLGDHGRDAEAFTAFERYCQIARDRVGVSVNTTRFAVPIYRSGEHVRALQMAKEAAEVNSFSGLVAYGALLDLSGDTLHAEMLYRRAVDRYGSEHSGELLAFLMRHQADHPVYAADSKRLMGQIFPNGWERAHADRLAGPPDAGLRIRTAGQLGERAGLRVGDVIVAVDGIRVRDLEQYAVMKFQSWAPAIQFCVWRGDRYLDLTTNLRHTWFYNRLVEYKPNAAH